MGMFDYVRYPIEIPGRDPDYPWQTKSLEPTLREYEIGSDGVLRFEGEVYPYTGALELYDLNEDATEMITLTLRMEVGVVREARESSVVIGDSTNDIVTTLPA